MSTRITMPLSVTIHHSAILKAFSHLQYPLLRILCAETAEIAGSKAKEVTDTIEIKATVLIEKRAKKET